MNPEQVTVLPSPEPGESSDRRNAPLLFLTVFIIATCGLIYELVAGTLASYLLGDSVTQFSTVIGVYLCAMGIGSYLSQFIHRGLAWRFVDIELAVAAVGGMSAPVLFLSFARAHDHFQVVLYSTVLLIGILVGLEIPLLMRLLKNQLAFKDLVAQVLTFDYIGALVASLLFPLLLMPRLGLVRTAICFGLLNATVGLWSTWLLKSQLGGLAFLRARCLMVIAGLLFALYHADYFTSVMEDDAYSGEIIFTKNSPYQRIVVTRDHHAFQLFLSGNLQFNSADEYRYHEALVHPAFSMRPNARNILVAGGGDGLALREILKHPQVTSVTLVDLDPAMTDLGRSFPLLKELNQSSFADPRVHVVNADAFVWLQEEAPKRAPFDLAIVDFPDPNNFALGKLYTTRFYKVLTSRLSPEGVMTVQSTSPLFSRNAYWCIANTMEAAGLKILPYHLAVPSFGIWGFVSASREPISVPTETLPNLRYLTPETQVAMYQFPHDMARVPTEINRLNNQILIQYYDQDWKKLF